MREPHMTKTMLSRNLSCREQEVVNEITIAKKRDERVGISQPSVLCVAAWELGKIAATLEGTPAVAFPWRLSKDFKWVRPPTGNGTAPVPYRNLILSHPGQLRCAATPFD
jgi:hypothetical protein